MRAAILLLALAAAANCRPGPLRASETTPPRVRIPAGTFAMGASPSALTLALRLCRQTHPRASRCSPAWFHDERLRAPVALRAYEIDRTEVSNASYDRCVRAGACGAPRWAKCFYGNGSRPKPRDATALQGPTRPVVCVSFADAQRFCRWAGGRLPTELEWERAARGADGRIFPWGNRWEPTFLNWGDQGGKHDGFRLTAPVGSFPRGRSPNGALDMVGNAWEWARRYPAASTTPRRNQVIRGAGFAAAAHAQRVTKRAVYEATRAYPNVGFRCVYSPVEGVSSR